ncbi:MAG: SDR family oxidoreductase [Deltaproteobacteria bacterium]|nr:SDR family oxidoreductase [Deltaproteobacteria bacterium]
MKNVLVTGCSTGIGRALAVELAGRGVRVFATARRVESLAALEGPNLVALPLDVLDPAARARVIEEVVRRGGSLDVIVNNAGVNVIGPLVETPLEDIERLFETNVLATIAMIQLAFPHLAASRGRVVNLGSVIGLLPSPFSASYCASKSAVHMLSDVLRLELAPFGIDVVTVQPAAVRSEIEDRAAAGLDAYLSAGSRYRAFAAGLRRRVERPKQDPVSAEDYARLVATSILAEKAPRVVGGGRGAGLFRAAARLPPAVRDFFLAREFGLHRPAGG